MRKTLESVEQNAKDVMNYLQKNGLRMILWKGERSWNWGLNFCKLTDGVAICEFQILDAVPPFAVVELAHASIILYNKKFKTNIELKIKLKGGRKKNE